SKVFLDPAEAKLPVQSRHSDEIIQTLSKLPRPPPCAVNKSNPDPFVAVGEFLKMPPRALVGFDGGQDVRGDPQLLLTADTTKRRPHFLDDVSLPQESAQPFAVRLRVGGFGIAWREPLGKALVVETLHRAVNPAKAERFLHCIVIGDPRLANDTTARRVIEQVYDGLIELDPQLRPQPALAESWTQMSPTVWVFKLRKNVRFHDGTSLTAADVVFTYTTILDPALRAPLRGLYTPISRVEATDDETVRFTLTAPYAPLLKYADMGIVSKAAVDRLGADYATHPLGTGPYKFVSWQRNSRIVLEANAENWKGSPH